MQTKKWFVLAILFVSIFPNFKMCITSWFFDKNLLVVLRCKRCVLNNLVPVLFEPYWFVVWLSTTFKYRIIYLLCISLTLGGTYLFLYELPLLTTFQLISPSVNLSTICLMVFCTWRNILTVNVFCRIL